MSTIGSLRENSPSVENARVNDVCEESTVKKSNESGMPPNLKTVLTSNEPLEKAVAEEISRVTCSISIKFHDERVAKMYKTKFLTFISSFAEFCVQNENDSDCTIEIFENNGVTDQMDDSNLANVNETATTPKKRKKHSKAKKELFVLDATPTSGVQADLRYTTKFVISSEKEEKNEVYSQSSKSSCFNCGELHSLKDCTQPKDYVKINMARQKFKKHSSRYHLEDQKYSHLQPGRISDELRKALALYDNEAPHYVYLMRKLGYPPGWLEEAKLVHSNLDLFDIDGNFVKSASARTQGLDEEKIVEYPGFNVPFEKGIKDDFRVYNVPPYSENFSKKAMVHFFDKQFAKQEDNLETCDMEIDQDTTLSEEKEVEIKTDRNSPSLIDLEQQKQQLLEQLNEPKPTKKDSEEDSENSLLFVRTTCFGTPLLKSASPYATLPNPDNFSKDVSPVINFENLPNSTGKYEQLTDVLQKVRDTLKKVNSSST